MSKNETTEEQLLVIRNLINKLEKELNELNKFSQRSSFILLSMIKSDLIMKIQLTELTVINYKNKGRDLLWVTIVRK